MAVDPQLLQRLELADYGELLDIIFILDVSAMESTESSHEALSVKEQRKAFAATAKEKIHELIRWASDQSGAEGRNVHVLDYMATARMTAPANLVKCLARHPSVATIGLASAE